MNREDWTKEQVEEAINYIRDNFIFVDSKLPGNIKYNKRMFKKVNDMYPNMFDSVFEIYKLVTEDDPWPLFCPVCGKRNKPEARHCSCRCTQLDKSVRNKQKETSIFLYGNPTYRNPQKNKETCLKKYGCENVFQTKEIQEKSTQTKIIKYGNPNYSNIEKAIVTKKTTKNAEGKTIIEQGTERAHQTMLKRYGVKTPMECKKFANKQRQSMLKNNGVESPFQMESVRKKLAKKKNKSKVETQWLNNLEVPNDKEHRQVYICGKVVDGLNNGVIYEFLGDFWHGHPCLIKKLNDANKRKYKIFLKNRFEATQKRLDLLYKKGYVIKYCWQSDFEKNVLFVRDYKGKLEY